MTDITLDIKGIGQITSLGWTAPDNLTYDQWAAMAPAWGVLHKGKQFGLGDWIYHGERKWGEMYVQPACDTGISEKLLRNYVWVASNVPKSLRNDSLSWWHHKLVAAFTHEEIKRLLDTAAERGWSTRQLRATIADWKAEMDGAPNAPRSRRGARGFTAEIPLYSGVKEAVEEHYPTATPHQTADLTRFATDLIENSLPKRAWDWKRLCKTFWKRYRGWRDIAQRAEAQVEILKTQNAQMFAEILELNAALESAAEPEQDKADWLTRIAENY